MIVSLLSSLLFDPNDDGDGVGDDDPSTSSTARPIPPNLLAPAIPNVFPRVWGGYAPVSTLYPCTPTEAGVRLLDPVCVSLDD